MISAKGEKSVSLVINPVTFIELEIKADNTQQNLSSIYTQAIKEYLADCTPDRLKVFAAPGAGKRIRVNVDMDLYHELTLKIGNSGFNINDVVYTALECHLNKKLKDIAA